MLLGVLWSVMEPLGLLLMMTLVFGFLLRVSSDGYPYPVFVFSGLAGWLVFSRATLSVAASLSRSEEHTSELQSLMRISYAVFCLKKKKKHTNQKHITNVHN